jgi:hypothetical protein
MVVKSNMTSLCRVAGFSLVTLLANVVENSRSTGSVVAFHQRSFVVLLIVWSGCAS